MEYITLKNSDLNVSRLCMGGCPMGQYGWGKVEESELIEAVHEAINLGVNFFDTADTYGLGKSEITLGKAIKGHRNDVVIATKFGVRVGDGKTVYDNSPEWIENALDASLKRMDIDYVDLYQVHYRDGQTPLYEVVEELDKLKEKGKIRHYGLSNINSQSIENLKPFKNKFVSFQDEYSLACRKNEEDILRLSEESNLTPMTWGSLGQGILTGKYTAENVKFGEDDRRSRDIYVNFHGDKLYKNLEIVKKMKDIADAHKTPVSAVAIRFILDHIKNSVVLCGIKRPEQICGNAKSMEWKLNGEEIEILNKISK